MTTFDFQDGNEPVSAPQHQDPDGSIGGREADTAKVDVGSDAQVFGYAEVCDNVYAEVFGYAEVHNNVPAEVFGYAKILEKEQK